MRERLPVITTLAALGVVVVLGFWMYFTASRPPAPEPLQTVSAPPATGRSARVEERLQMLRESYAREQQVAAAPKADAPAVTQEHGTRMRSRAGWHAGDVGTKGAAAPAAPPQAKRSSPASPPSGFITKSGTMVGNLDLRPALQKNVSADELEETILHGADRRQRMDALNQLVMTEPDEELRVLSNALLEENLDPEVYVGVIDALGDYADDISPEMIAPALRNQNANVRFEAVYLLGDMDSAAARTVLQGATTDPDPEVRELAKGVLELNG